MLEICIERNPKCTAWSLAFFFASESVDACEDWDWIPGSIEDIVERCRKYWKVRIGIGIACT